MVVSKVSYRPLAAKTLCSQKFMKTCIGLLLANLILLLILKFRSSMQYQELDVDDYGRLIDRNFIFKHTPDLCQNSSPKFIVAVHSAPGNFEKRQVIRETWGGAYKNVNRVVFVVGETSDAEIKKKLEAEIDTHKDFIQGDFMDEYHNLTYKHLMIFKFVVYHCSNVEYVVKANDYAFINMPNLVSFIDQYSAKHNQSSSILCNTISNAKVMRTGTWAITKDEYPEDVYPTYCSGYSIIYPIHTVLVLYVSAQKSEYLWIDDVYMTGILPNYLGIKHIATKSLTLPRDVKAKILGNDKIALEIFPFIFGPADNSPKDMKVLWNYILKHTPKAAIIDYIGDTWHA